jgi:hypothetical protein
VKWAGLLLLVFASFLVAGAASPASTGCCREAPVSDYLPQWSSDGSRIAFVRADNGTTSAIYTVAASGGAEHRFVDLGYDFVPFAAKVRLSPDWSKVAVVRGTSTLKIKSVDGSDSHEVGTNVHAFSWAPDGRRLAFDAVDGPTSEVFVVNADGSGLRSVGFGRAPAWSPVGDQIAFVNDYGLYVVGVDGTALRLVHSGLAAAPSWSPDGDRIAFFEPGLLDVVSADGTSGVSVLGSISGADPPQWSPDGTSIAVSHETSTSIVDVATRVLRGNAFLQATWSPVADELAGVRASPCLPLGVYRFSRKGAGDRLTLDCHIRGTPGPDVLSGTAYPDIMIGLAGNDVLKGKSREDHLFGGPGTDKLLGGDWGDLLEGGTGADTLVGGPYEQDAYATIDDFLAGGPGPDTLRGGPGLDRLSGGLGNDVLRGGVDSDILTGGPGNDRMFAWGDPKRGFGGRPTRDLVDCGAGRHDVAYVDRKDFVEHCETVHYR